MGQYRKKPVQIEARLITRRSVKHVADWCGGQCDNEGGIAVKTPEGTMRGDPGDWIIRGVKGEFYPCKPDIFDATYEPVAPEPKQDRGNSSLNPAMGRGRPSGNISGVGNER